MFEIFKSFSLYFVDSVVGGIYAHKFLKCRYSKKFTLFAWIGLYFIVHSVISELLSEIYSFNNQLVIMEDISTAETRGNIL